MAVACLGWGGFCLQKPELTTDCVFRASDRLIPSSEHSHPPALLAGKTHLEAYCLTGALAVLYKLAAFAQRSLPAQSSGSLIHVGLSSMA